MTGQDFDRLFDQLTDKAYSAYLDDTKKERLFKMALYEAIEKKYEEGDKQKKYDELGFLIQTNTEVVPVDNEFFTRRIVITNAVAGIGVTITTAEAHELTTGDSVTIYDVTSTGALAGAINNNTYSVTVVTPTTFTIVVTTTGTYSGGGTLEYATGMLSTYMHLLALRTRFDKSQTTILSVSSNVITLATSKNLRTGQKVYISGVTLVTGLNGVRYIEKVGPTRYKLYSNQALDIPIVTSGTYVANACTLYLTYEEWGKPYYSDRKYSVYAKPKVNIPYYEEANGKFKIYPEDEVCDYVYMDYIKQPETFIDPTDTLLDLEDYYPYKFLEYICETAVRLFAGPTRDQFLYQNAMNEIIQNP